MNIPRTDTMSLHINTSHLITKHTELFPFQLNVSLKHNAASPAATDLTATHILTATGRI